MANVLIVDDDPAYGKYLEALLQRAGFECSLVQSGREALARLDDTAFDAAVTDIYMPELDGIEFVKSVTSQHSEVALLAVTGGGWPDLVDALSRLVLDLGVRRVFTKPIDSRALIETLSAAVANA